jgi:dihydrofolate synthase/folylpolyglutamate synthase
MSFERPYQETIEYLYALQKHGVKLALANSVALMEIMGNPHLKFPSIHVAGTNGKGSTSAFIAAILQSAGFRVGLYTSPHLVNFTERIRINNIQIPEQKIIELAQRVRQGYQQWSPEGSGVISPTFFEVTTAMAFSYFAEEGVDFAVVEVGMGGRLDSTNVIMPAVSVITNIDREHTEFLGDTLEQIAHEKAGIIKPGIPVVTGVAQPEVISVIESEAAMKKATVYRLSRDYKPENVVSRRGQVFDYRGISTSYENVMITMLGRYQVDNACLALAAIECLRASGVTVDGSAVRRGLKQTRWQGRMERVAQRPDIYLDGAHNPASMKELATTIRAMKSEYRRIILVIGILGDKDYQGMTPEIVPLVEHVVVTKPAYSRAMDVPMLATSIRSLHRSVDSAETVAGAIAMARAIASVDDLILITGSLYVVGEARALFFPDSDRTSALSGLKG